VFESSAALAAFDYFRVPYRRVSNGTASPCEYAGAGDSRSLFWPWEADLRGAAAALRSIDSAPFFARMLPDERIRRLVGHLGGEWRPAEQIRDLDGGQVGALWRSAGGDILLPFDPNEAIRSFWTERYAAVSSFAEPLRVARAVYYRARPLLPRSLQLRLRRGFRRFQQRSSFPRWPIETAADDLYRLLLGLAAEIAGEPIPTVAFWPRPWTWTIVLTHDVEHRVGYERVERLLEIELDEGYRSSWNFVPRNDYVVDRAVLDSLRDRGFEIGVHGLFHDGRDLLPRTFPHRLPAIRSYAERWGAAGFRSPATIRSPELIPALGFDYDSSFPDTAPYEPQAGGCCTWLPYFLGDTVELPITLEQDHTLYELLGHRDATLWLRKAHLLRARGGMALMITHPDYTANERLVEAYRAFLREFADDATAWKPLPRDVAAWWRRRSESTLERVGDEWHVVGPAAGEAGVDLFRADRVAVA
jgi:hypothetical protein